MALAIENQLPSKCRRWHIRQGQRKDSGLMGPPESFCVLLVKVHFACAMGHGAQGAPEHLRFSVNTRRPIVLGGEKIESRSVAMAKESSKPIAEGLDTASTQFRGFAAECVELAHKSHSLEQRTMYVNLATAWHKMALHWEKDFSRSAPAARR
ncbi:MAG: hypothetical protein WAK55_15665 [Xanthobacteraceae bacterium]